MREHRDQQHHGGGQRRGESPRRASDPDVSPRATAALVERVRGRLADAGPGAGAGADSSVTEGITTRQLMALQGMVGNEVVSSVMRTVAQRVPVTAPDPTETLYNQTSATGQATARSYGSGGTVSYDMVRAGDTGVTVTVRIKFLNQNRNSVDPASPGAPAGTPPLGTLLGSPTEIPVDDPDNRRAWATDMASRAVAIWNGRLTLVEGAAATPAAGTAATPAAGTAPATPPSPAPAAGATPATPPGGPPVAVAPRRLPVTFTSVPVFGLSDPADTQIIVHPMATVAGTPGQPIDSGNYYLNKGTYGNDDAVIAAHEYGHLLGIPDEYSQNSAQLNALIHQAAPGGAPSGGPALDKASIQRMVLKSLRQPLYDALRAALGPVTAAMRAQKGKVRTAMVAAAKGGVTDAAVTAELTRMLTARAEGRIAPSIPAAVAFETTRNFSSRSVGGSAVDAGFSVGSLTDAISGAYWDALYGAERASVAVPGVGNVTVDVADSVSNTTASGGANAASAAGVASTTVSGSGAAGGAGPGGPAAGGAGGGTAPTPGLPAITPPPTLVSQLTALPATWSAAGSLLETGVTPASFAKAMTATLKSGDAAAIAAAAALSAGRRPRKSRTVGEMYRRAYRMVQAASADAATQVAADLVRETVKPTLATSVSQLTGSIDDAVNRVMGTTPSGVAALGTPDPNMTALVRSMKTTLDANKTAAAANPGRDPMGPSRTGAAPAMDVTYSYEGLMGSSTTRALRVDQFGPLVDNFNGRFLNPGEQRYRAEVR